MKMSMSLLGKYLEKYSPEFHITDDELCILGVRFLSATIGKFSKEYIYIGNAKEYYQDSRYKDAVLLTNGKNQIICHNADPEELLNDVLSAFEFYNLAEQDLILSSSQGKPLSDLIGILEKLFDGAVFIFDIDGKLLSSVHEYDAEAEGLTTELESGGQMGLRTLGQVFYNEDGTVAHDISNHAKRAFKENGLLGTIARYLCAGEERIGYILMFPKTELEAMTALHLEDIFAENCILAKEFTSSSSVLMPKSAILENILKDNIPDNSVCVQLEKAVDLKNGSYILLLRNEGIKNYTVHKMLERQLRGLHCNVSCEFSDYFVILASAFSLEETVRCLKEKLPYGNFVLGISMMIQDITQISAAFSQAEFSLCNSKGSGVFYCKDFALDYLIQNLKKQEMSMNLIHPLLGILRHYDDENHTEMLITLCCYLKNNCSQTHAAQALNVHLNTLKYRLKKISEIGNIDFGNNKELFYLRLSAEMTDSDSD